MQTLPGKAFPLWDKSCESRGLCPVRGAWGTAPALPTLSAPTPVWSVPSKPSSAPSPATLRGNARPRGIAPKTHHYAGIQGQASHQAPRAYTPSQLWSSATGLRTPTWTWSSRRRRWKSRGSTVRVAGPTSASTPAPPPQPPQSSAPASSGAMLPALPNTPPPGLNTLTGPARLGVKHLPWLGTKRDMDLDRLAPCPGAQPAPGKLSARVSCKPARGGSQQSDAKSHLLPLPPSLSGSSNFLSNSVFLLKMKPRSHSPCRGLGLFWRAAAIYGRAQKSQGKDWDRRKLFW